MPDKRSLLVLRGRNWKLPDAKTYVEVAGKLLVWAVKSRSVHARKQFAFLASLYEKLVEGSAQEQRRRAPRKSAAVSVSERGSERAVRQRVVREHRIGAASAQ